jgi:hypothetical protein
MDAVAQKEKEELVMIMMQAKGYRVLTAALK